MNPAPFDLNDIEHEPSDEQLAALMDAPLPVRRNHLRRRTTVGSRCFGLDLFQQAGGDAVSVGGHVASHFFSAPDQAALLRNP